MLDGDSIEIGPGKLPDIGRSKEACSGRTRLCIKQRHFAKNHSRREAGQPPLPLVSEQQHDINHAVSSDEQTVTFVSLVKQKTFPRKFAGRQIVGENLDFFGEQSMRQHCLSKAKRGMRDFDAGSYEYIIFCSLKA